MHRLNNGKKRWVTQDEYDKKARELKENQYKLSDKLRSLAEATIRIMISISL